MATNLDKIIKKQKKQAAFTKRVKSDKAKKKELYEAKEWYTIRALLGHHNVNYYCLVGARERGKTFSVQDYVLNCWFNPKSKLYKVPFYWMRLNDIAIKNMLLNNAAKFFEPILVRKYHLENIKVKGDSIFIGKELLCRVYGLSTAYNNKGAALFDAEKFKGVNIVVDEISLERGQRRNFDIAYNLKMQIENITRSSRENVKIWFLMNNTEDSPEILSLFGFIPVDFGIYKLKRKHCIIDYIPNNAAYEKRRKNALANELDTGTGNFTNKVVRDLESLNKSRLVKPVKVIKFTKDMSDWFCIWSALDGSNVVCLYNNEKVDSIAMKRYINDTFFPELRDSIIEREDVRSFKYKDVLTQALWRKNLEIVKK